MKDTYTVFIWGDRQFSRPMQHAENALRIVSGIEADCKARGEEVPPIEVREADGTVFYMNQPKSRGQDD